MRKRLCFWFCIFIVLALAGCGGGRDSRPVFVAEILSDQTTDGDIAFDPVLQTYTITQGPETLLFGIDGPDSVFPEYRAFLDFPLDGSTGYDLIPLNARIVSATLEVFINTVSFAAIVPTLIDLVSYPVSGLRPADYDSLPILTQAANFFAGDVGQFVAIDVTPLMREAQRLGVADFQLRLLLDFSAAAGLVGIEDLPTVAVTAPLLRVAYTR